jgi:hypothetical protein
MRSRNLLLLLAGVTVALVTLFVSWRFGIVFFLLPLFFVWSWGGDGGGERDEDGGADVERSGGRAEGGGEDRPLRGGDEDERRGEAGLDGEGI